jgi:hypothetical protein
MDMALGSVLLGGGALVDAGAAVSECLEPQLVTKRAQTQPTTST